jgi:hypothetical protein
VQLRSLADAGAREVGMERLDLRPHRARFVDTVGVVGAGRWRQALEAVVDMQLAVRRHLVENRLDDDRALAGVATELDELARDPVGGDLAGQVKQVHAQLDVGHPPRERWRNHHPGDTEAAEHAVDQAMTGARGSIVPVEESRDERVVHEGLRLEFLQSKLRTSSRAKRLGTSCAGLRARSATSDPSALSAYRHGEVLTGPDAGVVPHLPTRR